MKKVLFTIAIITASLISFESNAQVKYPENPTETLKSATFIVRAKQPNAKKIIASLAESFAGLTFQNAMKSLNLDGMIVFTKIGVTKEEAASIKSALEAAGAEVEVK